MMMSPLFALSYRFKLSERFLLLIETEYNLRLVVKLTGTLTISPPLSVTKTVVLELELA
jgi:hypothetical protein